MLVDKEGNNIGVVSTREAQAMADEAELDLVEVAPNAKPPVCRIMDYGKFAYEKSRQFREAKKKQTKVETKSIRMRPGTSQFHLDLSANKARRWLEDGKKVQFNIRFRAREISYPELGKAAMVRIAEQLEDVAVIEQAPIQQGWTMSMTVVPIAMAKANKADKEKKRANAKASKPRNNDNKRRNDTRKQNKSNSSSDKPPAKKTDKKDGEEKTKEVQDENVQSSS